MNHPSKPSLGVKKEYPDYEYKPMPPVSSFKIKLKIVSVKEGKPRRV